MFAFKDENSSIHFCNEVNYRAIENKNKKIIIYMIRMVVSVEIMHKL